MEDEQKNITQETTFNKKRLWSFIQFIIFSAFIVCAASLAFNTLYSNAPERQNLANLQNHFYNKFALLYSTDLIQQYQTQKTELKRLATRLTEVYQEDLRFLSKEELQDEIQIYSKLTNIKQITIYDSLPNDVNYNTSPPIDYAMLELLNRAKSTNDASFIIKTDPDTKEKHYVTVLLYTKKNTTNTLPNNPTNEENKDSITNSESAEFVTIQSNQNSTKSLGAIVLTQKANLRPLVHEMPDNMYFEVSQQAGKFFKIGSEHIKNIPNVHPTIVQDFGIAVRGYYIPMNTTNTLRDFLSVHPLLIYLLQILSIFVASLFIYIITYMFVQKDTHTLRKNKTEEIQTKPLFINSEELPHASIASHNLHGIESDASSHSFQQEITPQKVSFEAQEIEVATLSEQSIELFDNQVIEKFEHVSFDDNTFQNIENSTITNEVNIAEVSIQAPHLKHPDNGQKIKTTELPQQISKTTKN